MKIYILLANMADFVSMKQNLSTVLNFFSHLKIVVARYKSNQKFDKFKYRQFFNKINNLYYWTP